MAEAYKLYKTNPANGYISIPLNNTVGGDGTVSSLSFVGPGAANFGPSVNADFLYLLENFANSTPPANPILGQTWYDSSNKKLKIYDSVNWNPVNGIWQQSTQPKASLGNTVNVGDIWVDTSSGQLKITLDALTWTLVGPTYSSTLKSGSYAETITDIGGSSHQVIKNYIDDQVIEIIAKETFTPNPPIAGFASGLAPGLNLSSTYNSTLNATSKYAKFLSLANGTSVSGDSLVRTDIDSTINASLNVQQINVGSLAGGGISPWSMKQISGNSTFINPKPAGRFSFQVTTNPLSGIPIQTETLVIDGTNPGVGIGLPTNSPVRAGYSLDVGGQAQVQKLLNLTTTTVSLISSGTIVTQTLTALSTATTNDLLVNRTAYIGTSIVPVTSGTVNIGTQFNGFGSVFANLVTANTFNGKLVGSASSLTNASPWAITGHVQAQLRQSNNVNSTATSFYGQSGQFTFISSLTNAAISSQSTITNSQLSGTSTYLLVSDQQSLWKITYSDLFSSFIGSLVPSGVIMPFAGLTPPAGWLLCDGLYVSQSRFPTLFSAIGFAYGQGAEAIPTFALPDLRSRSVIGFDDMNNNSISNTLGTPGARAGLSNNLTPSAGLASIGQAPLVKGSINVTTGSTAVSYYQAMNYIIKI